MATEEDPVQPSPPSLIPSLRAYRNRAFPIKQAFHYDPVPITTDALPPYVGLTNEWQGQHWRKRLRRFIPSQYAHFIPQPIREIYPHAFDYIDEYTNGPAVFQATAGTLSYLTVFINRVNRSSYAVRSGVRVGAPTGPGINISQQINSRATCDFTVFDEDGAYRPGRDDEVAIYMNGTTLVYLGSIERTEEVHHHGTTAFDYRVHCTDAGTICDRRVVNLHYTDFMGGLLGIIVGDIINRNLTGTGITLVWTIAASTLIGEKSFYARPVTEVFNELARIANCDWRIDFFGNLRFFTTTNGTVAAPTSFTDGTENWINMRVTRTRGRFANRIYAKSDRALAATWTDTKAGNAVGIFETTYAQTVPPIVKVNGVAQAVVELAQIGSLPFQFYYISGGIGVFRNQNLPALGGGDTVTIAYPSPLPYVAIAEDTASIADVGLLEAIVEGREIHDKAQLQEIADGALARGMEEAVEVEVETRVDGFEPGQLVTISTTQPLASGTFLVESVNSREVQRDHFVHTIKASDRQFQRSTAQHKFFGDLIERGRLSIDRVSQLITFGVAVTIQGITNPGLTVGPKKAIKIAQRKGILGWATLRWKSVDDGAVIASAISIDVFRNGTSIFAGGVKMAYPAGQTGTVREWRFVSDPFEVAEFDVFTMEVLAADAAAKDGTLELVILG